MNKAPFPYAIRLNKTLRVVAGYGATRYDLTRHLATTPSATRYDLTRHSNEDIVCRSLWPELE